MKFSAGVNCCSSTDLSYCEFGPVSDFFFFKEKHSLTIINYISRAKFYAHIYLFVASMDALKCKSGISLTMHFSNWDFKLFWAGTVVSCNTSSNWVNRADVGRHGNIFAEQVPWKKKRPEGVNWRRRERNVWIIITVPLLIIALNFFTLDTIWICCSLQSFFPPVKTSGHKCFITYCV